MTSPSCTVGVSGGSESLEHSRGSGDVISITGSVINLEWNVVFFLYPPHSIGAGSPLSLTTVNTKVTCAVGSV